MDTHSTATYPRATSEASRQHIGPPKAIGQILHRPWYDVVFALRLSQVVHVANGRRSVGRYFHRPSSSNVEEATYVLGSPQLSQGYDTSPLGCGFRWTILGNLEHAVDQHASAIRKRRARRPRSSGSDKAARGPVVQWSSVCWKRPNELGIREGTWVIKTTPQFNTCYTMAKTLSGANVSANMVRLRPCIKKSKNYKARPTVLLYRS
ncbi:hypothetical protein GE09DRAFT_1123094 [Coniochaeta sp. 2T2.1]|nr:hypothetical protein GE09DRAFT_1123094 [Coniochaeta sp. 2T2.1]